jgi:acid phosphatase
MGRDGHQIVATVAARGLSEAAAAQVALLLDGKSLADVAALPDEWRKTEKETAEWHYVNIPKSDTAYNPTRDCPPQTSEVGHNCAVAAIEHFKTVLADRTASKEARARALIFVVHFVGDIHQPLHNADNHDLGGNKVLVTWFGAASHTYPGDSKPVPWNLHTVWDDAMIERTGLTVDAYAGHLLAGTQPANATSGSTIDWVNAAYKLAKTKAYVIPAGKPAPIGKAYYTKNLPVVDSQLLLAGLRLRSVLEAALGATPQASSMTSGKLPAPSHVVIVIDENKAYTDIIGSSSAPYINALAARGALLTAFYAQHHPSQPNYVAFFAGSTLTVCDDTCPTTPFTSQNLGAALIAAGKSFTGFAENLPPSASTVCKAGNFARKHCPWLDFSNVPASSSSAFSKFPHDAAGFANLPDVSLVIPNLVNDMHNGSAIAAEVNAGDVWLKKNLAAYADWAEKNNSLLIVTWDEDSSSYTINCANGVITTTPPSNRIATIFVGQAVGRGTKSTTTYTHQNLLRTVLDMYGATPFGGAATATDINDIWK